MKKVFFHGILAGALSALTAIIYNSVYCGAMMVDFTKIINTGSLIGSNMFGCILASLGYYFLAQWIKKYADIVFNTLFVGLTFASLVGPFSVSLPLDISFPEMFIGLVIPMHFFPVIFWLATKSLFEEY